jgi:prevent-host-death family protein
MKTEKLVFTLKELGDHPSEVLGLVQYGRKTITLTKRGKVIAKIIPADPPNLAANPLEQLAPEAS